MIIEYNNKYDEDIKDLLLELQEYIASIDIAGYNIVTKDYREQAFINTMKEVQDYEGKIYLYQEDNKIVGLIIGIINNEEKEEVGFQAPKRGRITELIVTSKIRSKGIGTKLLHAMEDYLHSVGCENILIGVFGYNKSAEAFYKKNGYNIRMLDMALDEANLKK